MNVVCLLMGTLFIGASFLNYIDDNQLMYAADLIISQVWICASIVISGCRND